MVVEIGGQPVEISHPGRVVFPEAGLTKLDLVRYYEAVADGALRGAGGRPNVLVRFVEGIAGQVFWKKRAPPRRPGINDRSSGVDPPSRGAGASRTSSYCRMNARGVCLRVRARSL